MQNKLDGNFLRYNDPVVHGRNFLRALVNAVRNGHIPKWKADQMKREFDADSKEV